MSPPADMSSPPSSEPQERPPTVSALGAGPCLHRPAATTAASHRDSDASLPPSREAAPAFGTRPPASARRPTYGRPLMASPQPDSTTIAQPCTDGAAGLGAGVSTHTPCDSSAGVSWSRTNTRRQRQSALRPKRSSRSTLEQGTQHGIECRWSARLFVLQNVPDVAH